MKCTATFIINGKTPVEVTHDGSLSFDGVVDGNLIKFLETIKNTDEWITISRNVEEELRNKVGHYKPVSLEKLTSIEGLIGNSNVRFLQDQFPEAMFPENAKANILFLDNLKLGGQEYFGRYIKSNGEELFIVRNNDYEIHKFAKFLYLRHQLNSNFELSEQSEYYKILNALKGDKTINETLEEFSINPDKYKTKTVTIDGEKILVYSKLNNLIKEITNVPLRKQYDDVFTNEVNSVLKHNLDNSNKPKVTLKISELYNILNALSTHKDYSNIKALMKDCTSIKKFKEKFGEKLEETSIYSNGFEKLLSELFEDSFPYVYQNHDAISITLSFPSNNIEDRYGITYQTIALMEIVENYNGYKIYAQQIDDKTYYFPSLYYLTEKTKSTRFNTLEEAKEHIDNMNSNGDVYNSSMLEFHQRITKDKDGTIKTHQGINKDGTIKSSIYIPEGTIIEVKDVEIPSDLSSIPYHYFLTFGNNRKSFERIINTLKLPTELHSEILSEIKTPEDMSLFIANINDENNNVVGLTELKNKIVNNRKKAYYIESVSTSSYNNKKTYSYKLIETEPNIVRQYQKTTKNKPILTILTAISESFKSKFNTNVHILNESELKEKFPDIDEGVKAFIRNGEIYVNLLAAKSSDLLHEYTHLLLGVLKSNPESVYAYEELLNMVVSTKEGRILAENISENYPDLSEMDLREEVFATLFGQYLQGRGSDINEIFKEKYDYLLKKNKNIFDLTSEDDLKQIYNKSLISIFERFSSDVANKLNQNDGLAFAETVNTRKKTNWINKQIKDGFIKEECNG